jgi:hypothetical protein
MPSLPTTLSTILTGLRDLVAAAAHKDVANRALLILAYRHIGRLTERLLRLMEQWRTGTLPKPGKPRPGRPSHPRKHPHLPMRRAWLRTLAGFNVSNQASGLRLLIASPEFAEFLAAAPQAARHLRPLWRIVTTDPPPPPIAPPPRAPKPRLPPRPRAAPPPLDLPAHIRAAARAWKTPEERRPRRPPPAPQPA